MDLNIDFVCVKSKFDDSVLGACSWRRCCKSPPGALTKLAQRVTTASRVCLMRPKVILYTFEPLG
jgi:hypothetical protein